MLKFFIPIYNKKSAKFNSNLFRIKFGIFFEVLMCSEVKCRGPP